MTKQVHTEGVIAEGEISGPGFSEAFESGYRLEGFRDRRWGVT